VLLINETCATLKTARKFFFPAKPPTGRRHNRRPRSTSSRAKESRRFLDTRSFRSGTR